MTVSIRTFVQTRAAGFAGRRFSARARPESRRDCRSGRETSARRRSKTCRRTVVHGQTTTVTVNVRLSPPDPILRHRSNRFFFALPLHPSSTFDVHFRNRLLAALSTPRLHRRSPADAPPLTHASLVTPCVVRPSVLVPAQLSCRPPITLNRTTFLCGTHLSSASPLIAQDRA